MPAKLPAEYEKHNTVGEMEPGQVVYVVPWAMGVTSDGSCYINDGATYKTSPAGVITMRVAKQQDGYHVWPVGWFSYRAGSLNGATIPVATIHTKGDECSEN